MLIINNISVEIENKKILKNINLNINAGEFHVIIFENTITSLQSGNEIGIFDGDQCVGAYTISNDNLIS